MSIINQIITTGISRGVRHPSGHILAKKMRRLLMNIFSDFTAALNTILNPNTFHPLAFELRGTALYYAVSYVCTTLALLYTLPSSTLKLFSSENTTLNRVMTDTEISFMGSLSNVGSLLVTPICGYLLDILGRKRTLILFYLPQLFSWIILVTIKKVEAFLLSMFLSGLSGSVFLVVPVFVGEYCQVSLRGSMTSGAIIFFGIGIMTSYIFGSFLDYNTISYVSLTMTVLGLLMLCFIKESPLYLMKKGFEEEAAESIEFYRGLKPNSKEVIQEIENLRKILTLNLENMDVTPEEERLNPDKTRPQILSIWKFLAKSRSTRRALLIILALDTAAVFQGLIVIQIYAKPLLETAVSSMSSTLSASIFALVIIISGLIGAYLVDTVGRRPLLISAAIANGLCCLILATQVQLNWGPSWLTAVFINFYFLFYVLGAGTVPYVLGSELFLPQIKSFGTMVYLEWSFMCNFILLFIFNPQAKSLGLETIFYIFAICCFITAFISCVFVPETKSVPVDVIQLKLLQGRI